MTTSVLASSDVAARLEAAIPDAVEEATPFGLRVKPEKLVEAARLLRDDRATDARYLNCLSGADRHDYFEVIYNVSSLSHNHEFTLKVRADHDDPVVPSVVSVWYAALLQEREAFDLLGIRFEDHPDLKRIFLWEGFPGHPLRKSFRELPGGFHPGLQRFPKQDEHWGGEFRAD